MILDLIAPSGEQWRSIAHVGIPVEGLEVWIVRGHSTASDFANFFRSLNELHRAHHGFGIRFVVDDVRGLFVLYPEQDGRPSVP